MDNKEISLADKRKIYLDMCQAIHEFCAAHGIKYYLAFGTLLGAVRHHGFIPWDDDFDIMMSYEDYQKFFALWDNKGRYKIIDCNLDRGYCYSFPRIYDSYTYRDYYGYCTYGVSIDLYTILKSANGKENIIAIANLAKKYNDIAIFFARCRGWLMRWHAWPSQSYDLFILNYFIKKSLNVLENSQVSGSFSIVNGGVTDLYKAIPNDCFNDIIKLPFEDYMFNAPREYDEVLKIWYNDYMVLPLEEKRKPYHGGIYYWR